LKKSRIPNSILAVLIVFVAIYGVNILLSEQILSPIRASIEAGKPASLQLTLLTNDCNNCFDMNNAVEFIKSQNVTITQEESMPYAEAQSLISSYNIKSLPALVITGDINKHNVMGLWQALGAKSVDGAMIVDGIPPYYSLDIHDIVGLVQIVKLTDASCQTCYDVDIHAQILPGYGISADQSVSYDISSTDGKLLLQKYNITKIPTILLSPDTSVYSALNSIWGQVGTIEGDGWYVFRSTEQMGTYKDIGLGNIVSAA
jgi:hypothetical protein